MGLSPRIRGAVGGAEMPVPCTHRRGPLPGEKQSQPCPLSWVGAQWMESTGTGRCQKGSHWEETGVLPRPGGGKTLGPREGGKREPETQQGAPRPRLRVSLGNTPSSSGVGPPAPRRLPGTCRRRLFPSLRSRKAATWCFIQRPCASRLAEPGGVAHGTHMAALPCWGMGRGKGGSARRAGGQGNHPISTWAPQKR